MKYAALLAVVEAHEVQQVVLCELGRGAAIPAQGEGEGEGEGQG